MLLDQQGSERSTSRRAERQLRGLMRHRGDRVESKTAVSNRIHSIVDQLFPGFLDEEQSGIAAFSETSLWLMEDRFSPRQIRGRQMKPLVAQAKKRKLLKAEEAIRKLKEHAGAVLSPVPEWVGCQIGRASCRERV